MTFDGEPQLPLQYKWCSINYQETKEEKKSLKEANQKQLLILQKVSTAIAETQDTANIIIIPKNKCLPYDPGDLDHLLSGENGELSETIWHN